MRRQVQKYHSLNACVTHALVITGIEVGDDALTIATSRAPKRCAGLLTALLCACSENMAPHLTCQIWCHEWQITSDDGISTGFPPIT